MSLDRMDPRTPEYDRLEAELAQRRQAPPTPREVDVRIKTQVEPDFSRQVGKRLETFRKVLELPVKKMSKLLLIKTSDYPRLISGKASYNADVVIYELVGMYGLRAEWLFKGTGNPFGSKMERTPKETYRMFSYIFIDNKKKYNVDKWVDLLKDKSINSQMKGIIETCDLAIRSIEKKKIPLEVTPRKSIRTA